MEFLFGFSATISCRNLISTSKPALHCCILISAGSCRLIFTSGCLNGVRMLWMINEYAKKVP